MNAHLKQQTVIAYKFIISHSSEETIITTIVHKRNLDDSPSQKNQHPPPKSKEPDSHSSNPPQIQRRQDLTPSPSQPKPPFRHLQSPKLIHIRNHNSAIIGAEIHTAQLLPTRQTLLGQTEDTLRGSGTGRKARLLDTPRFRRPVLAGGGRGSVDVGGEQVGRDVGVVGGEGGGGVDVAEEALPVCGGGRGGDSFGGGGRGGLAGFDGGREGGGGVVAEGEVVEVWLGDGEVGEGGFAGMGAGGV